MTKPDFSVIFASLPEVTLRLINPQNGKEIELQAGDLAAFDLDSGSVWFYRYWGTPSAIPLWVLEENGIVEHGCLSIVYSKGAEAQIQLPPNLSLKMFKAPHDTLNRVLFKCTPCN